MLTYLIAAWRWLVSVERETVAEITRDFNFIVTRLEASAQHAEAEAKKIEADIQGLLHKQVNAQIEATSAKAIAGNVRALLSPQPSAQA